jgi:hypothetical protein
MKDIHQLNTKSVGEAAKYVTAFRVTLLGASADITTDIKNIVIARPKGSAREITLRVKSRRSGDWQIPTTEGRSPEVYIDEKEFWVLVDFSVSAIAPDFYIMPGKWLRNNIYIQNNDYLASHGGERPVTPKSSHHAVTLERIVKWKDRWDILEL